MIHQTGAQRKRVSIGENEKCFIVECYNLCHGKDWKEVLLFAKQRVIEAGLPDHVVRMYLEQSTDRLTGRMRNIIKYALRSAQPANQPTMSTGLDETPALIARQTKYSTLMTPSQRKAEAVKRKLDNELVASSLESSEEENGRQEEKKRKIEAKEAQLAHQKMCQKAMDTMNNVNDLLAKVNTYLDKSKK